MADSSVEALTGEQTAFLAALLTSPTVRHAAAECGVSERTAYRWMAGDVTFKTAFTEAKRRAVDHAAAILAESAVAAVDVLLTVATDVCAPPRARVSAAGRLLDVAFRVVEIDAVKDRVAEVEAALAELNRGR